MVGGKISEVSLKWRLGQREIGVYNIQAIMFDRLMDGSKTEFEK